ncbi:MAG: insulinase family protein [Deltaproteobacteria bacterium]|nr:insulinase family protein [Deltaproteobacteria bacterium]
MRHRILSAAVIVVGLAARAHADGDPHLDVEKYTLPNGLEVILAPDQSVPLVAVNVWYHVGSGNEVPHRSGFAHLFEHMMFQGSKNTGPDAHFKILREVGASDVNGTTNTDRTNYFEVVPSNQIETALWLESDRMGHLLDILDKKELENQIDVVRNEKRQNYDNVAYRKALFSEFEALYPEGHPYRHLTIGLHEDLVAASVEDVKNFFRTWYVPSNATLTISGDFDTGEAKKLVEKWFGSFPRSAKPAAIKIPAPTVSAKEVSVEDSFAKLRQVSYVWHSPASYAPDDAELDIAAAALGREGWGRLYKRLVYEKQLAQSVRVNQGGMTFSGIFDITVTLRSGADLGEVKKIVMEEVERIKKENLDQKDLDRVIASNESGMIHQLENLNNRANVLQEYNQFLGDPNKLTWDLDRYRKTTPAKVREAAARYLDPAHMITVITNPAGGSK